MSKEIICKDCQNPFILTDEEIKFFESKIDQQTGQSLALPKRCKKCRALKRQRNQARESHENRGGDRGFDNQF